ncbi:MAG: protein-glutamate O-methyltransferase CheR [Acidobacteria bacterium]|nr:protein-glutamate O-methyltransferase CheR [Acidobacteriota bacterium]
MALNPQYLSYIKLVEKALAARFGWQTGEVMHDKLAAAVQRKAERLSLDEWDYCQTAIKSPAELQALAEFVINSETRFFRDPQQFDIIRQNVLPQLVKARAAERALNIWSAACSTGEEAYSLAILLQETLPADAAWKVNVMATDLRGASIIKATQGRYTASSLALLKPAWLARYFVKAATVDGGETTYTVLPEIKKLVTFRRANLYDDEFWKSFTRPFDLIVCNHLLLYFHALAAKHTVGKIVGVLKPGGVLTVMKGEAMYVNHGNLKADESFLSPFFKKL